MKAILKSIKQTISEVATEKTKAVKAMDYEKAGILRNYEKELMGLESRMISDHVMSQLT